MNQLQGAGTSEYSESHNRTNSAVLRLLRASAVSLKAARLLPLAALLMACLFAIGPVLAQDEMPNGTFTDFQPRTGSVGDQVVLTGTGFDNATQVAFNGVPAQFVIDSPTQITATVPAGATTGDLTVTLTEGTAERILTQSPGFTVTDKEPVPTATAGPTSGPTTNPTTNATGTPTTGPTANPTANATANPTTSPTASPTTGATPVPAPAPTIGSFSPTQAGIGSSVVITGSNFTGATGVRFNGVAAAFTVESDTTITVVVPAGATSGPISITTPGGTAVSNDAFLIVAPTPTPSGDRVPPTVSFTSPGPGAGISGITTFPDIRGNVNDGPGGSGVSRVELTLRRQSDGKYWNGTEWITANPQTLPTPVPTVAPFPTRSPTPTPAPTPDGSLPAAPVLTTTLNGDGTFSRTEGLPSGSELTYGIYTLVATAIDNAGNRRVVTNEVKIEPGTGGPTPTPTVGSTPTPQTTPQQTTQPTSQQTTQPTAQQTTQPTSQQTTQPTSQQTTQPTISPTVSPSSTPPPIPTATPQPTPTSTPLPPPAPGVVTTPQPTATPLAPVYEASAAYMISIPYMDGSGATSTTTPNRAFNMPMVSNGRENYRLYGFDAITQQYAFLDGESLIERGRGYFLAPLERGLRIKSPDQDPTRRALGDATFTITLRRDPSRDPRDPDNGYNLIGFPFDPNRYRSIDWEESTVTTPDGRTFESLHDAVAAGVLERTVKTMYEDSSSYFSTTIMRPFKGYWARTFVDGVTVTLVGRVEKPIGEDPAAPVPTATATTVPLPGSTVTPQATPVKTAVPGANGAERIVFSSQRDTGTNYEIYSVKPDGSDLKRLTTTTDENRNPTISPNGNEIVFTRNNRVFKMNADGSNQRQILDLDFGDDGTLFRWSPDSSKILLSHAGSIINADGSGRINQMYFGRFSPDSKKITYQLGNDIYVVNADGTNRIQLTTTTAVHTGPIVISHGPHFSRDGTRILFARQREGSVEKDYYSLPADGSNLDPTLLPAQPTTADVFLNDQRLSPDGTRIVMVVDKDLSISDFEGTNHQPLVPNPADDTEPSWGGGTGTTPSPTAGSTPVPGTTPTPGATLTPGATPSATPTAVSGTPVAWGINEQGQLGDGTNTRSLVPVNVTTSGALAGQNVSSIKGGREYTLAIAGGKVYGWGANESGQLGNGTTTASNVPVAVDASGVLAGKTITAISAGLIHSLAVDTDGKVYAWGSNTDGQLGNGSNTSSLVPVAVSTTGVLSGKRVTAVVAGWKHSLALTEDGRLYAWGDDLLQQLGTASTTSSNVPVAVDMSGALAGKTVTAISVGVLHNLVLASDGKVYTWGTNSVGQLGNGSDGGGGSGANVGLPVAVNTNGVLAGKTIVAISASNVHSLAADSDGKVYAWGNGTGGQLGNGASTNSNVPVAVDVSGVLSGKKIVALAGGNTHSLALDSDGRAYGWGNAFGNGTNASTNVPVAVDTSGVLAGKKVLSISGSNNGFHSVAITGSGPNPSPTPGSTPNQGDDLIIAQNRTTNASIVVAADAGTWEKQAAADLQKYIELMSGAKPPVVNAIPAGEAPVLVVGSAAIGAESALSRALNDVAKKNPTIRADAVVVRRSGNRIYLAGTNDESHYFAASWLLQRWGCRWYLPTEIGEVVPEVSEIKVGDLNFVYAPPFEIRHYWISWNGSQQGAAEFRRRNFMTETSMVGMGHALGDYTADLAPTGGTVFNVPFSEATTAQHVASKIEADYAAGKDISLAIEDGNYSNNSASDQALITEYDKYMLKPSLTDAMMTLYNNVGRILRQKYPNSKAKIGGMAYANVTMPPKIVNSVEPNIVMWIAPIDIDPIHGMDDPKSPPRQEYRQMMERWADLLDGRLAIYDYDQGMLVWRDMPNPSHTAFAQDVKHYQDAGILGIGTESRNAIATVFTNLYFRGQLMWNPDADVEDMLDEFYEGFYGPAEEPMADYWNAIYDAWDNSIVTEHEYFVAPAIYTPQLVAKLRDDLAEAQSKVSSLRNKVNPTRNERLYVQRIDFAQKSFEVIENYMAMVTASATNADYQAAAGFADKGLVARDALTAMNPTFTSPTLEGNSPAWWQGEPAFMRELAGYTNGSRGTLITKTPLEWRFKRGTPLPQGWTYTGMEGAIPQGDTGPATEDATQGNGWRDIRTDMYLQSQGILNNDGQSYTGHYWYQTSLDLTADQAAGNVHIMFPGMFNEAWLYVNGQRVAHRTYNEPWWLTDYKFTWDVDLTGKLNAGRNVITVRGFNPHHLGGMFRRPFLYRANN